MSLIQLDIRIEKNQKKEEAKKADTDKEKIDKAMRFSAKHGESACSAAARQRTDRAIKVVKARVQQEEARRKRAAAVESDDDCEPEEDTMQLDADQDDENQVLRRQDDDDEVKKNNSKAAFKPLNKDKALQSLRLTKKNKKFNAAAFADDVAEEEEDFKAIMRQATLERADFTKGLVAVKEYESQTEGLRVEQDNLKLKREEKRKDLQVVWVSPVFQSPNALEGCAISSAPTPSDAFATPPENSINACVSYYNYVFEQGLPLRVQESRLCHNLCNYCFYLGLFID